MQRQRTGPWQEYFSCERVEGSPCCRDGPAALPPADWSARERQNHPRQGPGALAHRPGRSTRSGALHRCDPRRGVWRCGGAGAVGGHPAALAPAHPRSRSRRNSGDRGCHSRPPPLAAGTHPGAAATRAGGVDRLVALHPPAHLAGVERPPRARRAGAGDSGDGGGPGRSPLRASAGGGLCGDLRRGSHPLRRANSGAAGGAGRAGPAHPLRHQP